MVATLKHPFPFDPSYGYSLDTLLEVEAPKPLDEFARFWQTRYQQARRTKPKPEIQFLRLQDQFSIYQVHYYSTARTRLTAWLAVPTEQLVTKAIIFGHGYGGCAGPDLRLRPQGTALLFPCFRGLSASALNYVSNNPAEHVLYGIESRDNYLLGGCVEDIWLSVSLLEKLFPQVKKHIAYAGISFGGGIGALALAWDKRIQRAHLNVPTFGNQALRLSLDTVGSGHAVRQYYQQHPEVLDTLVYYDAASAARFIQQPMHIAAALFDPAVAPPGQFAIYNGLSQAKQLFVLEAGHFNYPTQPQQEAELLQELNEFFSEL